VKAGIKAKRQQGKKGKNEVRAQVVGLDYKAIEEHASALTIDHSLFTKKAATFTDAGFLQ
jgi:hypothetical protein